MKFASILASCAIAAVSAAASKEVTFVGEKHEPKQLTYVGDVTSGDATVTFSKCGSDNFQWSAGPAVKGSTVTMTATGTIAPTTSGSYTVTAQYLGVSLVNQKANLGQPMNVDINILGTDFGHLTTTMFPVPAAGAVTMSVTLPVPNLSGTINGVATGTTSAGQLFCVNVNLAL